MSSTENLINTIVFSIVFVCLILNVCAMEDSIKNQQKFNSIWFILSTMFETFMLINCPIFPWSVF